VRSGLGAEISRFRRGRRPEPPQRQRWRHQRRRVKQRSWCPTPWIPAGAAEQATASLRRRTLHRRSRLRRKTLSPRPTDQLRCGREGRGDGAASPARATVAIEESKKTPRTATPPTPPRPAEGDNTASEPLRRRPPPRHHGRPGGKSVGAAPLAQRNDAEHGLLDGAG
jgi:hypothetical protein